MCDKTPGLPIVLARYALATEQTKAPALPGRFKVKENIPLGDNAHYTLRLLRPGYVYVYNPEDKGGQTWRGYIVTSQGYLYPFHERIGEDGPEKLINSGISIDPCNADVNGAIAQCITIPDAEKAKDIWIAYSDVEWTKRVWKRFDTNEDGCRDKAMRKFSVSGWLGSTAAEHAALAKDMVGQIAEFSKETQGAKFDFSAVSLEGRGWLAQDWGSVAKQLNVPAPADPVSPTPEEAKLIAAALGKLPKSRQDALMGAKFGSWDILLQKMDRLTGEGGKAAGKGLVLALDDPAGILTDIQILMDVRHHEFHDNQPEESIRKREIGKAIEALRSTVEGEEETKTLELMSGISDPTTALNYPTNMLQWVRNQRLENKVPDTPLDHREIEPTPEEHSAWIMNKVAQFDRARQRSATAAWEPYEKHLGGISEFMEAYRGSLQEYIEKEISPLDGAHVAWFRSETYFHEMKYFFDGGHIHSGEVYAVRVSRCMGSMQDKPGGSALAREWAAGKVSDERNYYLRALVFNQDEPIRLITEFCGNTVCEAVDARLVEADPKKVGLDEVMALFAELNGGWSPFITAAGEGLIKRFVRPSDADAILGALLNQGAGAILAQMNSAELSGKGLAQWQAILGAHYGSPIALLRTNLTPGGLYTFVTDTAGDVLGAVSKEVRFKSSELGKLALNAQGAREQRYLVAIDLDRLSAKIAKKEYWLDKNGNPLKGSALKARHMKLLRESQVDLVKMSKETRTSVSSKGRIAGPVVAGTISIILSLAGMVQAHSELKGMRSSAEENRDGLDEAAVSFRLAACLSSSAGALSSFAGSALDIFKAPALRMGRSQRLNTVSRDLKTWGRGLGVFGGVLMVASDILGMTKARKQGDEVLARAYIGSGAIGGTLTWIAWYTTLSKAAVKAGGTLTTIGIGAAKAPVFWVVLPLVMAGVVTYSWIARRERKLALQTWLDRSSFGKDPRYYPNLDKELEGLKLAFEK